MIRRPIHWRGLERLRWSLGARSGVRLTGALTLGALLLSADVPSTSAQVAPPQFARLISGEAPRGSLNEPLGVAASPAADRRIFVVDHGNARIQVFTSTGLPIGAWGRRGRGPGEFFDPTDVAVSPDGRYVYVVDRGLHKVKRFQPAPECFEEGHADCFSGAGVLMWGYRGRGDGGFVTPTGIAVDGAGNVYVSDWSANDISKFSADGVFLKRIGSPGTGLGQLMRPTAVEVDAAGRLWVADRDNDRLARFKPDGSPDDVWTNCARLYRPTGLALNPDGGGVVRDYDPQYRLPRVWRFNARMEIVDGPRVLSNESLDDSYPFQGASMLQGGGAVLTDAFSVEMSLFMIAPEGEIVRLARRCTAPDYYDQPVAVALDQDHYVVAELGSDQVTIIDPHAGDRAVRVLERPDYSFSGPTGVAVQRFGPTFPEAVVYIADPQQHMVVLVGPDGTHFGRWGDGTPRVGGDGLRGPQAVAVSPNGDVFIADTLNHRVVHRAAFGDGSLVRIITGGDCPREQGELQFPVALAVGPDGKLFTLERGRNRVRAFSDEGRCLGIVADGPSVGPTGEAEVPVGVLWMPVALAADDRYLYVLENDKETRSRIQVFSLTAGGSGRLPVVAVFAEDIGPGPGEFWRPSGIAVSPDGRILIADTANNRLQLFQWPGTGPTTVPTRPPTWTPQPTATATATATSTLEPASPTVPLTPTPPTVMPTEVRVSPTPEVGATATSSRAPVHRAFLPTLLRR